MLIIWSGGVARGGIFRHKHTGTLATSDPQQWWTRCKITSSMGLRGSWEGYVPPCPIIAGEATDQKGSCNRVPDYERTIWWQTWCLVSSVGRGWWLNAELIRTTLAWIWNGDICFSGAYVSKCPSVHTGLQCCLTNPCFHIIIISGLDKQNDASADEEEPLWSIPHKAATHNYTDVGVGELSGMVQF